MKVRKDLALIIVLLVVMLSLMSVFVPGALSVLDKVFPALMLILGAYFEKGKA